MTPMKKDDLFPAIIWMLLGVIVAVESYRLKLGDLHSPGPGLMPFLFGVALSLCSLPILIRSLGIIFGRTKQNEKIVWSGIEFKKLIIVVITLVIYSIFLETVGFLLTAFLILLILFKITESQKWLSVIVLSVITVISVYMLFVVILKVELPQGLLRIR
jgi:putative tricarboxylic transport membrane protein